MNQVIMIIQRYNILLTTAYPIQNHASILGLGRYCHTVNNAGNIAEVDRLVRILKFFIKCIQWMHCHNMIIRIQERSSHQRLRTTHSFQLWITIVYLLFSLGMWVFRQMTYLNKKLVTKLFTIVQCTFRRIKLEYFQNCTVHFLISIQ